MKIRHSQLLGHLLVALALGFSTTAGAQQIISLNWGETGGTSLASTDTTGVEAADNWNNALGSSASDWTTGGSNLLDSEENPTTIDWAGSSTDNFVQFRDRGGSNSTEELLHNGVQSDFNANGFTTPNFLRVTFSEITAPSYDVYVYTGTGSYANNSFTIGDLTYYNELADSTPSGFVEITSTNSASPTSQGTYAVFRNITGSSFTLTVEGLETGDRANLTGIQIVAVPEPDSGTLIGLGAGVLLLLRRRKR